MANDSVETNLMKKLKPLERKIYKDESALLAELESFGIPDLGEYWKGSSNRNVARKQVARYLDYRLLREIDPLCKRKRACIIVEVYDAPKDKLDQRGRSGTYIDKLRPLIIMTGEFSGLKIELLDRWKVYEPYKQHQIKKGAWTKQPGRYFNPWKVGAGANPGTVKYCGILTEKENDSLFGALDSLQKESIVEWGYYYVYVPAIETEASEESELRPQAIQEWEKAQQAREKLISELASKPNCVLKPELYREGGFSSSYKQFFDDYRINNNKPGQYRMNEAQSRMYENFRLHLRQRAYSKCENLDGLCPIEEIPNGHDIFEDWHCRKRYYELSKELSVSLLGMQSVWKEFHFKVVDKKKAEKYLSDRTDTDVQSLGYELGCAYIGYMSKQMSVPDKIYFPEGYENDHIGHIGKFDYGQKFSLDSSKSAKGLHQTLLKLYSPS